MALTKPRAYQIYDIDYKQAVRVVTVSNITLAGGAPNSVDSVTLSLNDRVLVTGQTSKPQNGIYYVTTLGTGSNGTWTRSTDTDATGELLAGTIVMVTEGGVYSDTQWKLLTNDPIVIGVTDLNWAQNFGIPYTAATVPPTANVVVGSQWFNTTTNVLYEYQYDGTSYYWIDQTGPAIGTSNVVLGTTMSNGTSSINVGFNGNANVSVAGTSNVVVIATTGAYVTGIVSASGNITGANLMGVTAVAIGDVTSTSSQKLRLTSTGTNVFAQIGNGVSGTTGTLTFAPYFQETAMVTIDTSTGNITAAGNIAGGNIKTAGIISATGTITSNGVTNSTAFAVGNAAVSNVALGFFPDAGVAAAMAIRDYSTVTSTMYFDIGMGGNSTNHQFQYRGSNAFTLWGKIDQYGINLPTRPAFRVYGNTGTNWTTGTTLSNQVIDYNQGSNYVNSTGIFTAPVAGLYSVWLNARAGSTASLSQVGVFRNNDTSGANVICFWEITTSATTTTHFGVSSVTKLAVGDTLRVKVQSGGINFDTNDNWGAAYIG